MTNWDKSVTVFHGREIQRTFHIALLLQEQEIPFCINYAAPPERERLTVSITIDVPAQFAVRAAIIADYIRGFAEFYASELQQMDPDGKEEP